MTTSEAQRPRGPTSIAITLRVRASIHEFGVVDGRVQSITRWGEFKSWMCPKNPSKEGAIIIRGSGTIASSLLSPVMVDIP